MNDYDALVVGAGHNGLVCAAYLARAGMRVGVLERSDRVGGILATAELEPGVRCPALVHTVGRLRDSVVSDLRLGGHGLELLRPDVRLLALQPDGAPLVLEADAARTARTLAAHSATDAAAYPRYDAHLRSLAGFVAELNAVTPPRLDRVRPGDVASGLRLGRAFRALGPKAARELTRALPMAVADFVGEWFESDRLRGALALGGLRFTGMGPWSAGTTAVLLGDAAEGGGGAPGETAYARGGPGALAEALAAAARAEGVELRVGSAVSRLLTADGRCIGVVTEAGEELRAGAVVSAVDPKTTLTRWLDPNVAGPQLRWRAGNIRTPGATAKVNLALSGLPAFTGVSEQHELHGRIVIAAGIDHLERAFDASKYGEIGSAPHLEATIPTLADPSLADPGRHVLSVLVQWVPYALRDGDWDARRDELGELVVAQLERFAPGLAALVTARQVLTPLDLERGYGLPEGHVLHVEPGLDQFFAWRPVLGMARYRLAVPGLYLCGSGAHPGGGITGGPGQNAAREIVRDMC